MIVAVFFAAFTSVAYGTGSPPWLKVGVDAAKTQFPDLESITSSWDCESRGIEAFPNNPCDPYGRPANYPRVWTRLGRLGFRSDDLHAYGIVLGFLFFAAALVVAGPLSRSEGVLYDLLLIAPVPLLGVERGNVDLLMFVLVSAAVMLVRRSPWLASAALSAAAILKLFPFLAIGVLLARRARLMAAIGATIAFAAFLALTFDDVKKILRVVPLDVTHSYGAGVIAGALWNAHALDVRDASVAHLVWAGAVAAGFLCAFGLIALRRPCAQTERRHRRDAFYAGAGIYMGTYILGTNFDYRLVFLLLCVPQLCAWAANGRAPVPLAALPLVTIAGTFLLSSIDPPLPFGLQTWYVNLSFPPEEILNWLTFAWLIAAFTTTILDDLSGATEANATRPTHRYRLR